LSFSKVHLKMLDIQPFDQFMLGVYAGFLIGFNALCWIYGDRF